MKNLTFVFFGLLMVSLTLGVFMFIQKEKELKILSARVEKDTLSRLQDGTEEIPRLIATTDEELGFAKSGSLICTSKKTKITCFLSRNIERLRGPNITTFTIDANNNFSGPLSGINSSGDSYTLPVVSQKYFVLREVSEDFANIGYIVFSHLNTDTQTFIHGRYDTIVGYDAGGALILAKVTEGVKKEDKKVALFKLDDEGNVATSTSITLSKQLADEGYLLGVDCSLIKNTPICYINRVFATGPFVFNDSKGGVLQVYIHNTMMNIGKKAFDLDYAEFYKSKL